MGEDLKKVVDEVVEEVEEGESIFMRKVKVLLYPKKDLRLRVNLSPKRHLLLRVKLFPKQQILLIVDVFPKQLLRLSLKVMVLIWII